MLPVPPTRALRPDREHRRAGDPLLGKSDEACLKAYVRACRVEAAERLILATLGRRRGPAE